MSFHSATPRGPANTISDCWLTPKSIIDKIGISDLDPCGWLVNGQPIVETARNYIIEEQDGLSINWNNYESVFCNFPYSDAKRWMKKAAQTGESGGEVIVLCFARTDTKWFSENTQNATGMNFIKKRVKFLNHEGVEKSNGNAPSVLIAWGEKSYQRIKKVDGILVRIDK